MTNLLNRRLPLIAFMVVIAAGVFLGCESQDELAYENPLDPRNPGSSDPFGLTAVYAGGWVTLEWTVPSGPAIAQIVVESIVAGQPTDLDTLETSVTTYIDTNPLGNAENQYRLRAEDEFGRAAQTSQVVAAAVFVPPVIDIPAAQRLEGTLRIQSATQDVVVRATTGDVVQLDTLASFAAARTAPIVAEETGFTGYGLLSARTAGGIVLPNRQLYTRAGLVSGADTLWVSGTDSITIQTDLVLNFGKLGGGTTVAAPEVDISLLGGGTGIDSLRFATSREALAAAAWQPSAEEFLAVPLRDTPGAQELWVQYLSDFGFDTIPEPLVLSGDDLSGASLSLVLPESGIVEGRTVGVELDAEATEVRLSTSIGFEDATWQAYTDSLGFTLRDAPGPQTIYAQFRNQWFLSSVLAQEVLLSASTIDVVFTAPVDGDPVSGGSEIAVTGDVEGLAVAETVTRLEINTGEGWQDLPADTTWATSWTVPAEFTVDTPWLLGVRATATNDTSSVQTAGVTWIEVTITQLGIAITRPVAGGDVYTGTGVSIRGNATRDLTAAELDSVVVTAGDTVMVTTEALTGWEVTWNAPAVAEAVPAEIIATVFADTASVADTVQVNLLPPEPEEEDE